MSQHRARALGVPVGLLAMQGDDEVGREIRAAMTQEDMSTQFINVSACRPLCCCVYVRA